MPPARSGLNRQPLGRDARLILAVQAVRAFAYGLGSVVVGLALAHSGHGRVAVGVVLTTLVGGAALATLFVARFGDAIGRRRLYVALLLVMAGAGTVFAVTDSLPLLIVAALTGTVSTEVIESGPFSSLEQAMLPQAAVSGRITQLFGTYNAIAAIAGSLGALAASSGGDVKRLLLAYPFAAAVAVPLAGRLSADVDAAGASRPRQRLHRSRRPVARLAALFALDSFAGGFVVQAFIAYWLADHFGASASAVGAVFFAVGLLQALSFQVAVRLADRAGLLETMVVSHLASNVVLAAIAFAPNLAVAIAFLLSRQALSQMDVPTRQAYVVGLVDVDERTAAAAYTNTARYIGRPLGPLLAGVAASVSAGAPFVIGGALKAVYDLTLYGLFRDVPLAGGVAASEGDMAPATGPAASTERSSARS